MIGASRFVYNHFLSKRIEKYKNDGETSSFYEDCSNLTSLKNEMQWLKECDKYSLQNSLRDLDKSYKNFFKHGSGFPKFKTKRKSISSFRTTCYNKNIEIKDNMIKFPKLKWVKYRDKRDTSNVGKILNATITRSKTGKYYVSISTESIISVKESTGSVIGIDLGLKEYLVTSDSETISNPRWFRKSEEKINKLQSIYSRRQKGSKNKEKSRIKLAKAYEKVSNQRKYFQQKLSTRLINENQIICLETLKSSEMVKNRKLSKSIQDASWYEFTRQLEYKGLWHNRSVVKISQFYPSSQICSNCGNQSKQTKDLRCREYNCTVCGLIIDRDLNACYNIREEGLRNIIL